MADLPESHSKPSMRTMELEIEEGVEQELTQFQLLVLTCTLGGLQVIWSILNGNINVFLLSIGIPASVSPLIWITAPLCGVLVQPVVGWLSDQCTSQYGRRKPFIFFGMFATVVSLVGLSYSQNMTNMLTRTSDATIITSTTVITVIWTILLNISIQPLQMGIRALVIDGCSKAQQPQANAWAGCAASIGNVFGYLVSFTTASTSIHVFGFGHFKYLAVIASLCLTVTVTINLLFSKGDQVHHMTVSNNTSSLLSLIRHFRRADLVSSRTRIINTVQFCAWMGWFPFLFYMTAFVSSLSGPADNGGSAQTRRQPGALAGFLYALVSCIGSLLIPQLLRRTKYASAEIKASSAAPIATLFGWSLEEVWFAGQIFFGILMFSTVFAFNTAGGVVLIAFAGVPWALANYIPFALIGVEVAEQRSLQQGSILVHADDNDEDSDDDNDELEDKHVPFGTGATIGLHNAAISAPQIIAALVSAVVLKLSTKFELKDGIGWVMRLSGIAALMAAWQIKKLFH